MFLYADGFARLRASHDRTKVMRRKIDRSSQAYCLRSAINGFYHGLTKCPPDTWLHRCAHWCRPFESYVLPHQTKNQTFRSGLFGGGGRIRTIEAIRSRFTVCPLWPLGNSPIFDYCLNGAGRRTHKSRCGSVEPSPPTIHRIVVIYILRVHQGLRSEWSR